MQPHDLYFASFLVTAALAVWVFDTWERGRRVRKQLAKLEQPKPLIKRTHGQA